MIMTNALLLILLLLLMDANVASATSGRIHLRGRRAKSSKPHESKHRNADTAEEDSTCQCIDNDIDLIHTNWNMTHFTWKGFQGDEEETLHPVDLTRERRGMTLLLERSGSSGTCGNNRCWGVSEEIANDSSSSANSSSSSNSNDKIYWIHDLARTRMASTPQEEAYAVMLTRSPYIYHTCEDSCTNRNKLQLFEVDIDEDDNLVPGRRVAIYDQINLLF